MKRHYYFVVYLLWLAMVLSTHDAHAVPEDTTPDAFGFAAPTGINAPASASLSGGCCH